MGVRKNALVCTNSLENRTPFRCTNTPDTSSAGRVRLACLLSSAFLDSPSLHRGTPSPFPGVSLTLGPPPKPPKSQRSTPFRFFMCSQQSVLFAMAW